MQVLFRPVRTQSSHYKFIFSNILSCHSTIFLLSIGSSLPLDIQCSSFITICLGPIGMDHVLSELSYKVTILQRSYSKITIYQTNK